MFARLLPRFAIPLIASLIFAIFAPLSASAATGGSYILLTLDGIKGESTLEVGKGAIDITSITFGAVNPGSASAGSGSGSGKPAFQEFSFTKLQDSASLSLLAILASGKTIKSGTISFYNANTESKKPYLTIKLENIFVTSDTYATNEGNARLTESFTLAAKKLTFTYQAIGSKGEPLPAQTFEYDLAKNKVS
ncbi:Hcp family type VI secretion system effector [Cohnella sp. GCM10012308]|uniref:Hcp family type VI secretion system effector n=1 Tax=Cohnella sp. GCM10012308 TaxID=3317329 RepID=UPI00360D1035